MDKYFIQGLDELSLDEFKELYQKALKDNNAGILSHHSEFSQLLSNAYTTYIFNEKIYEIYADKNILEWCKISMYQPLTEDIMRKYKKYLDWYLIRKYQTYSQEFAIEFKDLLDC